ncbi:hypothetical protein AC477_00025 [miscellaneous Crenarchaeota group-1 archaeon SG8-32-1]|uniref:Uncharacterized protein n=1 Tax=miscellaneous Crenarchaeota group-1 archaeon SG8-32-1 TaxID=1685124 RepID=A0A0M0C1G6_9ARCH|nr:MAG: hypothetical protein AC477_00025 [miscellaneous Crenarchaeota group-1 archaeon SG8-32-1]
MSDIQNIPRSELVNDLTWARGYGWICRLVVNNYNSDIMTQPVEWFQERVDGCYEIIARVVFEIARRNNVHRA